MVPERGGEVVLGASEEGGAWPAGVGAGGGSASGVVCWGLERVTGWAGGVGAGSVGKRGQVEDKGRQGVDGLKGQIKGIRFTPSSLIVALKTALLAVA